MAVKLKGNAVHGKRLKRFPVHYFHQNRGLFPFVCAVGELAGYFPFFRFFSDFSRSFVLTVSAAGLLAVGAPGWTIAVGAIYAAPLATIAAVYAALKVGR